MILDHYFDRVVIISLNRTPEKLERCKAELRAKGLSWNAVHQPAVDGSLVGAPSWWKSGGGAWGCLQSHVRVVQDALRDGVERLLVVEDDCIWQATAASMVEEFMEEVPGGWGQIYFGGQLRGSHRPTKVGNSARVMKAPSVHRTHVYALSKEYMVKFLRHVLHAPDHIEAASGAKGKIERRHIDHQLEVAQRRGDWPVYIPSFWIAGQGENLSTINLKQQTTKWWHQSWGETYRRLPLVVIDADTLLSPDHKRHLHFGYTIDAEDSRVDLGVAKCDSEDSLLRVVDVLAREAMEHQQLPAVLLRPNFKKWLEDGWSRIIDGLPTVEELGRLCDFPNSKVINHPWINPPRKIEFVEVCSPEAPAVLAGLSRSATTAFQCGIQSPAYGINWSPGTFQFL
jgi:GR25 family glycosyltransferase involved in LPS biosynthesis